MTISGYAPGRGQTALAVVLANELAVSTRTRRIVVDLLGTTRPRTAVARNGGRGAVLLSRGEAAGR